MGTAVENEITKLLVEWRGGDNDALDRMMPLVYDELRRLARNYMNSQPSGQNTLQTTALIHEAYLKLAGDRKKDWKDRSHFFAVAATAMRHILVDHARARSAAKRNAGVVVSLEDVAVITKERADEFVALDDALNRLAELDARKARVVELRYFGGLTVEETSEVLQISNETVMRDWKFAKSWLHRELSAID